MPTIETTLTQKGQVTIPAEVRRALGLKPRDKVTFELDGDVARIRRAASKIARWYGAVAPRERPEDFREAREQFEKEVAEEADRRG
ncbi:MAG: AbrB/MazE/SpoVT family DNA-binding domain-containing protein [Chloroflexota bacterium]